MANYIGWLNGIIIILIGCFSIGNPQSYFSVASSSIQPNNTQKQQHQVCNIEEDLISSCSVPIENLSFGSNIQGILESRANGLTPSWMNLTLARQGQKFANDFLLQIGSSHFCGLVMNMHMPNVKEILLFTQNSDSPEKAARRYIGTMTQVLIWYKDIFTDRNDTDIFTSLKNVRKLHLSAAQRASDRLAQNLSLVNNSLYAEKTINTRLWKAFAKDLEISNIPQSSRTNNVTYSNDVPINQFEIALTQFAFVGLPVAFPERLGILAGDDDIWAFNHLWAVIGYVIGVDDQYNIALQPNLTATKEYYERILNEYYLPSLFNPDFTTKVLVEALLQGIHEAFTPFSPRVMLYKLLTYGLKTPAPNLHKQLTPTERVAEVTLSTIHFPLFQSDPVFRQKVNSLLTVGLNAVGFRYFGGNYTSQTLKAKYAWYPQP